MNEPASKTERTSLVSIVIPSYKRADDLRRCLKAIQSQHHQYFEALVVCRPDDRTTRQCIVSFKDHDERFNEVLVEEPGLIAALNTGFSAATGEYVTFTDDDAEAPSHWLATITTHFNEHPECGAVGGQDRLQIETERLRNPPPTQQVGIYTWTGKFQGNHHCPIEKPFLRTEMLKGVNMTYRHKLIKGLKIGEGLRGFGAQVGTEASLAHCILSQSYEMHFVRDAWVKHHVAERTENDDRMDFTNQFALDSTYNNHYILARYKGKLCWWRGLVRAIFVGSRGIPGFLRTLLKGQKPTLLQQHWPQMRAGGRAGLSARKIARNV